MTKKELLALTQRLLDRLEFDYLTGADGEEFAIPVEDGPQISVCALEIEDAEAHSWPVLFSSLVVHEDVEPAALSEVDIGELNGRLVVGKLATAALESGRLRIELQHECVGWPGGAELRVTWEQMGGQGSALRSELGEILASSNPTGEASKGPLDS